MRNREITAGEVVWTLIALGIGMLAVYSVLLEETRKLRQIWMGR